MGRNKEAQNNSPYNSGWVMRNILTHYTLWPYFKDGDIAMGCIILLYYYIENIILLY